MIFKYLCIGLFLTVIAMEAHTQPTITKIEPANWWVGMKWNTVQLMLYGKNLNGIEAKFEGDALKIKAIHTLPNPNYAFIDVEIPENTRAGNYNLWITQNGKTQKIAYPIWQRTDMKGRNQGFNPSDVVYLITPDRFANGDISNDKMGDRFNDFDASKPERRHGGDLQGIIQHLDYIKEAGFTAVWLNPVQENAGRGSYHGYAVTDLYKIDPRFGTNELYKTLVEKAHELGLKVIFDHIANHIGIEHAWMKDLPMEDWLNGTLENHITDKHYKHSTVDPYSDSNSEKLLKTFWFVDDMPDLNQQNPYLANYLIQNTLWWMEYSGLDGIREDTYPYPFQEFMTAWEQAILREYPNTNIVGEIWENQPAYIAAYQKDSYLPTHFTTNLPTVMDFPLMDAMRGYLLGEKKLEGIYHIFVQDYLYANTDNLFTFLDNHDISRGIFHAKGNTNKVKQMLTVLLTTRGIPQILYGTEINMMGGESHVELRQDFPGGFPQHTRNAFTASGRTPEENEVFLFLQKLLYFRQQHPALYKGQFIQYPLQWSSQVYKYIKRDEKNVFLVLVNGHDTVKTVELAELQPHFEGRQKGKDIFTNQEVDLKEVSIAPYGVLLIQVK